MQLRFYKGDYTDILKVVEAYPSGGKPGDFVTIGDQVLFWHPERGNWIAEQHGIGSNAAILNTLLEMYTHLQTLDDEIDKLWKSLIKVTAPTISVDAEGNVTLTSAGSTAIYYTIDGTTTPTDTAGTKYDGTFQLEASCTIMAVAVKVANSKSYYSDVSSKDVTLKPAKPTITVTDKSIATLAHPEGETGAVHTVALSCETEGATIVYKINDGEWQTYASAFDVATDGSITISAYASKNSQESDTETATFVNAKVATSAEYGDITVSFEYEKTSIDADGGTIAVKTLSAVQAKTLIYSDASTAPASESVTATPVLTADTEGFLQSNNSVVFGKTASARSVKVTASYTAHDKTGTKDVTLSQTAATITFSPASKTGVAATGASDQTITATIVGTASITSATGGTGISGVSVSGNTITYTVDANTDTSTKNKTITIKTSLGDRTYNVQQNGATYMLYWGFSESTPTDDSFSKTNSKTLANGATAQITTSSSNKAHCHWVAFKTSSGASIKSWLDADKDDVAYTSKTVGDYTMYYYEQSGMYILNTSDITISM